MTKEFAGHKKIGYSTILSPIEKKLDRFFLPRISPLFETYQLTWLTLLWSILVIVFCYFARDSISWLWIVSLVIFLQYITDHFDGAVGRRKHTGLIKWGYYMDHVLDYAFLCSLIIGYSFLVDESYRSSLLFCLAIFGGFMVNSFLDFSATNTSRISYFKVGPTEIRLLFIINNAILIWLGVNILFVSLPYILLISFIMLSVVIYHTQKKLLQADIKEKKGHVSFLSRLVIFKKYRIFSRRYAFFLFVVLFVYLNAYVYLTNPFNQFSISQNLYTTSVENDKIVLHKSFTLHVETNAFQQTFAYYKTIVHFIADTYFGSHPAKSTTVSGIIQDIHTLRFNPKKPYVISGDQFSELYPRNLGIFYNAMLDSRTPLSQNDWEDRQRIYLQSVAYALDTFSQAGDLSTTIVPIGMHTVSPINVYAYPSDSLYGIFYAISSMQDDTYFDTLYPVTTQERYTLQTQEASQYLLYSNMDSLHALTQQYFKTVYDPKLHLVRKDIHLSSARDAVIRSSSFYDNVILWKTLRLASDLGVQKTDKAFLAKLKANIISHFWYEKGGYFLDDLSSDSLKNKSYSSDWLIVLSTGFLDVNNPQERVYLERSAHYIVNNNIDYPFGLKYQARVDSAKEFPLVRIFLPVYGQNAIWSHWGMEYSKLLLLLYRQTGNTIYLEHAENTLDAYTKNIMKYKGYPETYDSQGNFLQNAFYKSVRQTGWVVNYEEAMLLMRNVKSGTEKMAFR